MEGMRFQAGLPLYEPGHATHLYGPLLSVVLGGLFSVTGLDLLAARLLFSSFALVLVGLLTWLLCRDGLRRFALLGALLFLAVNLRTSFVFFSTQPDCLAALLALLALVLWIDAGGSWVRHGFALGLFLAALLFKQTSAAFALIPIAHALLFDRSRLLRACLPAAFLLAALLALRFVYPAVFHGMVAVPGTLKVHYGRLPAMSLYLLATFPIFFVALLARLLDPAALSKRERWICSALVVLVPVSIWTTIKSGGGYNSLLFGFLALTAFVVVQLDRLLHLFQENPRRQLVMSTAAAVALLCSFFFNFERAVPLLLGRSGDEKYPAAVDLARQLGEGVVSPHDPTIAFRANGFFGRSLYFELDTHSENGEWPLDLPEGMRTELEQSRYVIQVETGVPSRLTPARLDQLGFRPLGVPSLAGSSYSLWGKK